VHVHRRDDPVDGGSSRAIVLISDDGGLFVEDGGLGVVSANEVEKETLEYLKVGMDFS
jgi:hypothetical protein